MVRSSLPDQLVQLREHIPADAGKVQKELERIASEFEALPTDRDVCGLIHFDFELDNLVWRGDIAQILDFDDCARGWYVADVAFALRDIFDAGAGLDDPRVRTFLDGYAVRCPLDEALLARLPLFSRLARLIQFGRITRSLDLDESPDNPAWLNTLIEKLRRRREAYQAELANRQPS
jgi:Ser/Thr protein kinase RdoA (MazF antagonist)